MASPLNDQKARMKYSDGKYADVSSDGFVHYFNLKNGSSGEQRFPSQFVAVEHLKKNDWVIV